MDLQRRILDNFFNIFDIKNTNLLLKKIKEEKKNNIYFLGVGKSSNIAQQTSDILKSLSYKCFNLDVQKLLHGDIGVVNNNLIIIYSKSGNTKEIVDIIDLLIERNCYLVGVFCNSNNEISKKCHLNIHLPLTKECDSFNLIPSMSITLYSIFTNILVENLSFNISLDEYGKNHPAGDIGKKSNLFVKDIMKQKEDCCYMDKNNTLRECIINMTEKRSQCCVFLLNNKLYGIVTDYDIRKYLKDKDDINISINDIINITPSYVKCNTRFNNIKHDNKNLSGIPVLDEEHNFIGLLDNKSLVNNHNIY